MPNYSSSQTTDYDKNKSAAAAAETARRQNLRDASAAKRNARKLLTTPDLESLHNKKESYMNTPSLDTVHGSSTVGLSDPPPPSKIAAIGNTVSNIGGSIAGAAGGVATGLMNKVSGIKDDLMSGGIAGIAGTVANLAGIPTDPASLARAGNLPANGELFSQDQSVTPVTSNKHNDWRVKINCNWALLGGSPLMDILSDTGGVVFPYLPSITIATKSNYEQVNATHGNFSHHSYQNSVVDDITIIGDFSAETADDALYWIAVTTFFKTATKMFFGKGQNAGNPPIICKLNGYGTNIFNNVPVIIKSFSVDLSPDVDYIKCNVPPIPKINSWDSHASRDSDEYNNRLGPQNMVPILSQISVVVSPIYSREKLRAFSLTDYAAGKLSGNYTGYM